MHIFFTIQRRWSGTRKETKKGGGGGEGAAVNAACQGNLSSCHFGHACHRFVSPALGCVVSYVAQFIRNTDSAYTCIYRSTECVELLRRS